MAAFCARGATSISMASRAHRLEQQKISMLTARNPSTCKHACDSSESPRTSWRHSRGRGSGCGQSWPPHFADDAKISDSSFSGEGDGRTPAEIGR